MPTYSYLCTQCGHAFDIQQSFTDDALTTCPECTGALRKVFGNVGVVFKGSGFYRNDARKDAKVTSGSSTSNGAAKNGKSGTGSGSDGAAGSSSGTGSAGNGSSSSSSGNGTAGSAASSSTAKSTASSGAAKS